MFKFFENRVIISKEKREMKESMNLLVEESSVSNRYLIFTALSAMLATFGIIMDNVTILIGAMLIAPLLIPVIGLSIGVGSGSLRLVTHSIKSLIFGIFVAIIASVAVGWLFAYKEPSPTIFASFSDSYLYFLVAFISGIAAVYSWLKPNAGQIVPGVAIAVALMPPVAYAGLLLVHLNETKLVDLMTLILSNLGGIFLGGLLAFLLFALISKRPTEDVEKQVDDEVEKDKVVLSSGHASKKPHC